MALQNLKENIEMEKRVIKEILVLNSQIAGNSDKKEKNILYKALQSCIQKLIIANNSIPALLDAVSPFRKLNENEKKVEDLVKISYFQEPRTDNKRVSVTLARKDKEKFLRELDLSTITLKRLKKNEAGKLKEKIIEFQKASWYAKISNKLFLNTSSRFFSKGKLKRLNSNLRKANMSSLVTTYMSMTLFTALISFFASIIIFIILLFINPINFLNILRNALIILLLPLITFLSIYFYPYAEAKSIESKINQELPFVTIHMSAIAGSGIEPTQIFKIIALGEEYKNTKKEFKKIVNQVNVYGYDLITALKNTARETSSDNLSELLNGIATTISGGGSLNDFLDKRAETLLFEYSLEKERKTKSAETFMDVYISIVIAAPMIMMLLLILISVSGMSIGLGISQLSTIIISIVALINVIFLVFLHLSQPGY